MLTDLISHLLEQLDDRRRMMVTMRLQGHSIDDIARQTNRTERTVIRVLNSVRAALRQV